MKILDFARAPNPKRVRAYIAAKGIDIEFQAVNVFEGEQRSEAFLAKNSRGETPVLELDDGTCIAESMAICRYLEEIYPDPPLFGESAVERARIEMWNRRIELELFRHVGDYFVHTIEFFKDRLTQRPEYAEDAKKRAYAALEQLDKDLEDKPYLAGEKFTIADITALVIVDLGTPSVFEAGDELKNVKRWWNDVYSRPCAEPLKSS